MDSVMSRKLWSLSGYHLGPGEANWALLSALSGLAADFRTRNRDLLPSSLALIENGHLLPLFSERVLEAFCARRPKSLLRQILEAVRILPAADEQEVLRSFAEYLLSNPVIVVDPWTRTASGSPGTLSLHMRAMFPADWARRPRL